MGQPYFTPVSGGHFARFFHLDDELLIMFSYLKNQIDLIEKKSVQSNFPGERTVHKTVHLTFINVANAVGFYPTKPYK